jgi:GT2 family glycosyltransferase
VSDPGRVVIAILTYDGYELTRKALQTLRAQSFWPVPTVVIDNGSATPEGRLLAEEFGQPVDTISLSPNRGVAGGYNAGIDWAMSRGASHVLLLNNDVLATDIDLIPKLIAATSPSVAAVGPLTQNSDGSIFSAGGRVSLWTGVASHDRTPAADGPYIAKWLDGPCLLISLEAVADVGPFDESLWMYWEDVEWCLRAGRFGWECRVQPAARIVHLRGATNSRAQAEALHLRNRMRVVRRYGTTAQIAASTMLFLIFHAPIFVARRARRGLLLQSLRSVMDACVWNARDVIRSRSLRGSPPAKWLTGNLR